MRATFASAMAAACAVVAVGLSACGGPALPCRYGDAASCSAACEQGTDAASCTRLGAMCETGNVESKPGEALKYYLRACLLGDRLGCHMAGLKFLLGKDTARREEQALRSFEAACHGGYGDGCAMRGALLASQRPPRTEDARELYKEGCALGGALGCRWMGEALGDTADAREYFRRACAGGDRESCDRARAKPASSASPPPPSSTAPEPSPSPPGPPAPATSASSAATALPR